MKFQPLKQTPALIALGVILAVSLLTVTRFGFFERLERITYDWRIREAARFPSQVASNLGCVLITDESIKAINQGVLGRSYGLYWPRHVYGSALEELAAQGANTVAFDVMFAELRTDHAPIKMPFNPQSDLKRFLDGLPPRVPPVIVGSEDSPEILVESDDQFAWQLHRSGIGLLAADQGVRPHSLFATNALGVGDISADLDPDGVLRRAMAFRLYTNWHFVFQMAAKNPDIRVDLAHAIVTETQIALPLPDGSNAIVPLDADGNIDLRDFGGSDLPPGISPKAKPYSVERVWHMGIVMAARQLKLNLAEAKIDLPAGRIMLSGAAGVTRTLPVDAQGYFHINWEISLEDPRLTADSFHQVLLENRARHQDSLATRTNSRWQDKLVVIGSAATGNDLTDHGATPLARDTFLVSKHWNVANSIISNRFIHPVSLFQEILLIVFLGILAALLTWQLRAFPALAATLGLVSLYGLVAIWLFIQSRLWLPLVMPCLCALTQNALLVTYRAVFEQREQRRIKSVFSKIVAPDVVNELLDAENVSLGGARREVTVMFADIRGFTELTDKIQEQTAEHIRQLNLNPEAAETYYDEVAEATLQTISLYLGSIADIVKKHGGTLDKYIGDCAMAFWGAPKPTLTHAVNCVRAAIEAQRGIHLLNEQRRGANAQLAAENEQRRSAGLPPKPLLPLLSLGTGINSGVVLVGLMGSDEHGLNYTVLGREVNLASRLETVSGQGRIIIGETTYHHLQRIDPQLAATCVEQEPTRPKGFQKPVRNFEVPWQLAGPPLSSSS